MKTISVNAVFGTDKEYSILKFSKMVMDTTHYLYNKYKDNGIDFFISFNIIKSMTVYHKDWGCPDGGEHTFTVESMLNPYFVDEKDINKWKRSVVIFLNELKNVLNQNTVSIVFSDGDFRYLNSYIDTKDLINT